MKATLCRLALTVVGALLIVSLAVLWPSANSSPAHAAVRTDGCGTGSNYSTTTTEYDGGGGMYVFYQDTCQATSLATTFRDRANNQTYCTVAAATIGTISTFFFGSPFALPAGVVAIAAFVVAGGCQALAAFYTGLANQVQAATQACGTQGITYIMDVRPASLSLYSFMCQSTDNSSSDLGLGTTYADLTADTSDYA